MSLVASRRLPRSAHVEGTFTSPGLLAVYPTLREAAKILRVSASTLSRRQDLDVRPRGDELRVPAAEVMRLGQYYQRRSLYDIGSDLLARARRFAPEEMDTIDEELQPVLRSIPSQPLSAEVFLREAERILPENLFEQVRRAYQARMSRRESA